MSFTINLANLYQDQFATKPFDVLEDYESEDYTALSSTVISQYEGREVWLPITFANLDPDDFDGGELMLPFATIKVSSSKTFIRTPLTQRSGTVKELYSGGDWIIQINGFLIDLDTRTFPEAQFVQLKKLYDLNESLELDNAITNVLLPEDVGEDVYKRVVITALDFPEVKGGKKNYKPFTMRLESDQIFTLEVE